ncbi:Rpn family recombination-promoting nuclease/putative transposase (plasmid) [Serratia symbiotica]|nr:Rpn family recombination-promoting nuclease/putative transposase [Serratia symbiotica]USS96935.1 Rpn family recombination-promoting nuclease/putative transposase [Serratia symbiotica]
MRAYYSDVLYSLKAGKGIGFVYCLIEHKVPMIIIWPFA